MYETADDYWWYSGDSYDPGWADIIRANKHDPSILKSYPMGDDLFILDIKESDNRLICVSGIISVLDLETMTVYQPNELNNKFTTSAPKLVEASGDKSRVWITYNDVFIDDRKFQVQNSRPNTYTWGRYTYNSSFIEDIFNRRYWKLWGEGYSFANYAIDYYQYESNIYPSNVITNYVTGVCPTHLLICTDPEGEYA